MNILGITAPLSWNQSCAIVQNGTLVAAAEEERFNRIKHSPRMPPFLATKFCLEKASISAHQIDFIAVGYRSPVHAFFLSAIENAKYADFERIVRETGAFSEYFIEFIRYKEWLQKNGVDFAKTRFVFIPHHIAHAASAFRTSGMDQANIITLDGQGEDDAGMLGVGKNNKINLISKISHHQGLGWVYAETTDLLGFKSHSDEGKVMALAAFGKKVFPEMPWTVEKTSYNLPYNWNNQFWSQFGPRKHPDDPLRIYHKRLAKTTQVFTENAAVSLARKLYKISPIGNFVLAGGVGLNCDMNAAIQTLPFVKKLYVYPAAHDAGTAVGAALEVSSWKESPTNNKLDHTYLGPEFSNDEIVKTLREYRIPFKKLSSLSEVTNELIKGKICGWFQGKMEFGPRALGNRSILSHPNIRGMKDKINANIKHREPWRPFAPSIIEEKGSVLFKNYSYNPFMTITYKTTPSGKSLLSQAIHIDQTARIQSVRKAVNPKFYSLLQSFFQRTRIPALLNTSFNDSGEPIVCSPRDAIRTFFSTGLDILILGDYILRKE